MAELRLCDRKVSRSKSFWQSQAFLDTAVTLCFHIFHEATPSTAIEGPAVIQSQLLQSSNWRKQRLESKILHMTFSLISHMNRQSRSYYLSTSPRNVSTTRISDSLTQILSQSDRLYYWTFLYRYDDCSWKTEVYQVWSQATKYGWFISRQQHKTCLNENTRPEEEIF